MARIRKTDVQKYALMALEKGWGAAKSAYPNLPELVGDFLAQVVEVQEQIIVDEFGLLISARWPSKFGDPNKILKRWSATSLGNHHQTVFAWIRAARAAKAVGDMEKTWEFLHAAMVVHVPEFPASKRKSARVT